jgi:hypothetical protein
VFLRAQKGDPKKSGPHPSRFASSIVNVSTIALTVLALNNSVPTSWMNAAHHTVFAGCQAQTRNLPVAGSPRWSSSAALITSMKALYPPAVKNSEPTTKVMLTARPSTSWTAHARELRIWISPAFGAALAADGLLRFVA